MEELPRCALTARSSVGLVSLVEPMSGVILSVWGATTPLRLTAIGIRFLVGLGRNESLG